MAAVILVLAAGNVKSKERIVGLLPAQAAEGADIAMAAEGDDGTDWRHHGPRERCEPPRGAPRWYGAAYSDISAATGDPKM